MQYLISLLLGYTIGSYPTAFLILKKTRKVDITAVGTGNVGAMNSYEVTNSKTIGIIVFLIDFLKGMLPLLILKFAGLNDFSLLAISSMSCIFAHCYNPWLALKGGRGLASAAGSTAMIFPFVLILWIILWIIFYLMKKDITLANVIASVMALIIITSSISIAIKYAFPVPSSEPILVLYSLGLLMIILSKHTEPLQQLIKSSNNRRGKI